MTVTRVRRTSGGTDTYGDPTPGTSSSATIAGAFIAPGASVELFGPMRDGVRIDATLFAPWGSDVRADDDIVVTNDGANTGTYRVSGIPADWTFHLGDGSRAGLAAPLTRVEG